MDREMSSAAGLSSVRVNKPLAAVNRLLIAIHVALATAAIALHLQLDYDGGAGALHIVMVGAGLTLLFIWALSQAGMWRPVTRVAFPAKLRMEMELPGVDVLVVTADPEKEPTVEVMNTVVSAMALDYPVGKLTVYLSDDAGSPLTLLAARKAYAFATTCWVPFCRKYNLHCPCPARYFSFSSSNDDGVPEDERIRIKKMYESSKEDLMEEGKKKQSQSPGTGSSSGWRTSNNKADHDAHVEIITDDDKDVMMPMLVYVSREKRRTSPHHFKAGALNVLLRVSGLMSNSPYVLVLDCDMKCNSRSSAMEAMCFHLDPDNQQQHLAFVQFPQMFHNLSCNDIYANELRPIFSTRWKGLDGLRGPILSGSGFYVRRDALYGATPSATHEFELSTMDSGELERRFGRSTDLLGSVRRLNSSQWRVVVPQEEDAAELEVVASCAYEEETGWGHQVGFLYQSVAEDYFTGYRQLFCRGWTSVYCYPAANAPAPFLGSVPTNLNDVLVQNKRWMSGMLAVGISRRYCPLLSLHSLSLSLLQTMAIAYYGLVSLTAFPVLCYGILTPLCFFRGVPLFSPNKTASFFAVATFVSSNLQHLIEVSVAKRRLALGTWWNEQRFWMLNAVTGQLFACVTVFLDLIGIGIIDFELTSKASNDDKLYQNGVFDFTGCSTLLLPATTLAVLNLAALLGGTYRNIMTTTTRSELLLPHFCLMCYVAALSYPLLEGMFLRQDAARVPARITTLSVALAAVLLAMFG